MGFELEKEREKPKPKPKILEFEVVCFHVFHTCNNGPGQLRSCVIYNR